MKKLKVTDSYGTSVRMVCTKTKKKEINGSEYLEIYDGDKLLIVIATKLQGLPEEKNIKVEEIK